jgi:hypothetical protein
MNHHFSFGKHKGKTFERVFFKYPAYADWIYQDGIYQQRHAMDEEEAAVFAELYRRANHLVGLCSVCKERPLTRMGLTRHHGTGYLGGVAFYCDECEYQGGSPTAYHQPSFFVHEYELTSRESKLITAEVKSHFIGPVSLTQARMQSYLRTNPNFRHARPLFFERMEATG